MTQPFGALAQLDTAAAVAVLPVTLSFVPAMRSHAMEPGVLGETRASAKVTSKLIDWFLKI